MPAIPPHPKLSPEILASDAFRMYSCKVLACTKRFAHDWQNCPYAHTGEKAARRCPRKYGYSGIACPALKAAGHCALGSACPCAHNVFEYWLHPTRYRTQLCNDGERCRRSICFFAHSLSELRNPEVKPFVPVEAVLAAAASTAASAGASTIRSAAAAQAADTGRLPPSGGSSNALDGCPGSPTSLPPLEDIARALQQAKQAVLAQPAAAGAAPGASHASHMEGPQPPEAAAHAALAVALRELEALRLGRPADGAGSSQSGQPFRGPPFHSTRPAAAAAVAPPATRAAAAAPSQDAAADLAAAVAALAEDVQQGALGFPSRGFPSMGSLTDASNTSTSPSCVDSGRSSMDAEWLSAASLALCPGLYCSLMASTAGALF